ncbi:unnamed protein product [Polarella glacialis]|uniref:Uncharacterized protein n=1 Tax=Polarella glacialis TaxID=89957 RepID=A0A813ENU1_POLGL|nr:unnamed protein product [Polarella glacialis]
MPHEPFYLLNWIIGETDHPDITSFETSPAQHKQRRWAWFRRHQVCPVVLEQFDLPWVIEHAAYPVVKTSSDDWDFRVDLRRPVDALPRHLAEIAPVLLAPQIIRWHVPLYKSLSHTADSQFRLRQAHAGRKMVMIDGRGCNTSELLWMDSELKQRGFAVLRVDTERRHGRHIFVQPRAMMRSLFEEHLPELAACQYLVHVTPKASAGQLIVEAALLGVLPLGSPHKMFARLLLPPELRAATLAEALATIDSLEAAGAERTQLLRATLRGRAERLVGAEDLPPLASYLRLLGSLREPGIPSAAISGFWRFAAGKSCGQGSVGKDEVQDHKAVSPRECAEYCKAVGGRAFVYEETRRLCSVFFRCVLKQPEQWNTDVFVLEEALHSMDDTPIVSLRPTSAQVVATDLFCIANRKELQKFELQESDSLSSKLSKLHAIFTSQHRLQAWKVSYDDIGVREHLQQTGHIQSAGAAKEQVLEGMRDLLLKEAGLRPQELPQSYTALTAHCLRHINRRDPNNRR